MLLAARTRNHEPVRFVENRLQLVSTSVAEDGYDSCTRHGDILAARERQHAEVYSASKPASQTLPPCAAPHTEADTTSPRTSDAPGLPTPHVQRLQ